MIGSKISLVIMWRQEYKNYRNIFDCFSNNFCKSIVEHGNIKYKIIYKIKLYFLMWYRVHSLLLQLEVN